MPLDLSHPRHLVPAAQRSPASTTTGRHGKRAVHLKLTEDVLRQLLDVVAPSTKPAGEHKVAAARGQIMVNVDGPQPVRNSRETTPARSNELTIGASDAGPRRRRDLAPTVGRPRGGRHHSSPPLVRFARPRPRRKHLAPCDSPTPPCRPRQGRTAREGEPGTGRTRQRGEKVSLRSQSQRHEQAERERGSLYRHLCLVY